MARTKAIQPTNGGSMRSCSGITVFFALLITILYSGIAIADDSAMSDVSGGTVEPMQQHPSIRMVSETVDMKLGAKVGWEWPVFVRCQFFLKNEGPATDVTIGFPEHSWAGGEATATERLIGFKSWVDGQPVKVRYVPSPMKKNRVNGSEDYKAWYVKKVHFDRGQTRRIVDVYSARLGYWNTAADVKGTTSSLTYVLRTGASWKGSIGSAVIRADLSEAGDYYDISATPRGFTKKGNVLTWTLKDLEPKEDINIVLAPKLPLLNGKEGFNYMWEPIFPRNGVLMVSPRFLDLDIEHDLKSIRGGTQLTIRQNKHVLVLKMGSKSALLDGKSITLKTAPWIGKQGEECAVPLEETVRLLGGKVKYDRKHRPNVILPGLQNEAVPQQR